MRFSDLLICILLHQSFFVMNGTAETKYAVEFKSDFIPDPDTSTFKSNYVRLRVSSEFSDVEALSYCFRIELRSTIAHCLFAENISFYFTTNYYGFVTFFKRFYIMFQTQTPFVPLKWYHMCISYEKCHFKMVMDNEVIADQMITTVGCVSNSTIKIPSTLQLGLCSDETTFEYTTNPLKSITRGTLTDFFMWSKILTTSEMKKFTTSCEPLTAKPDLVDWESFEVQRIGANANLVNTTISSVCNQDSHKDSPVILILPHKQEYSKAKTTCELLGGRFPLPSNAIEFGNLWSYVANHDINDKYIEVQCSNYFWMPIVQKNDCKVGEEDCLWLNDLDDKHQEVTYLPWRSSQPNGRNIQQCVTSELDINEYLDSNCDSKYCSLCQFDGHVDFNMHGLHEKSVIDRHYNFVPENQNLEGLTFFGDRTTKISWIYKTNQWEISDTSFNPPMLGYYDLSKPEVIVGKFTWSLTKYWDANDDSPEIRDLKLSKVTGTKILSHTIKGENHLI